MNNTRSLWCSTLHKIAYPVFDALSQGQLRACMPVESYTGNTTRFSRVCHLEAVGRTLAGIGPWLACDELEDEEEALRAALFERVISGLKNAVDPDSPDVLNFVFEHELGERQPLVDAAFLCHGLLRSKGKIWQGLDLRTKTRLIECLAATRHITPAPCNWLLFSSTVEVFMRSIGEEWDAMRIDAAMRFHEQWFLGDGWYGDGPHFATNYYNSFVIQPMLLEAAKVLAEDDRYLPQQRRENYQKLATTVLQRAQRHVQHLVAMVAPDGSFPALGRSITYRSGAFQLLAQLAHEECLPETVPPELAHEALNRVIRKTLTHKDTFNANGWLQIGLEGHQPSLAQGYVSTGSLYLCTTAFLPLGLSPHHLFWTSQPVRLPWETFWQD